MPLRTERNDLGRDKFEVKAFDMGKYTLPFPIRISDIDAMEDEETMRRLGQFSPK